MSKRTPLIVFGFDAGDPAWLLDWARSGHLPAVARVLERGWHARTTGRELISEHGVWTPLLSGQSRGDLGYYYFRQLAPGTYDIRPITGLDIKATYIWSRLAPGRKVAVVDVPEVFPTPGVPGIQLANWAPHFGWISQHPAHQPAAEPPELLAEARRIFGPPVDIVEQVGSTAADDRPALARMCDRVRRKGALCRQLLQRDQFDLIVVIFTEPHTAAHQFWKYRRAAPDAELANATRTVYQAVDRELALLLEQLGGEPNVIIASSVGLADYYPTGALTEAFCRQLGYQAAPGPAPVSWKPLDLARRVLPESWRRAASRHLPRDTREHLLAEQFKRSTDWDRTTAFALPTFYTSLIRVNLRGREPRGCVAPGAEYAALLDRIEADLRQLVDPVTNRPAIAKVERPGELFGVNPPRLFPDLWAHWEPAAHFRERVIHPRATLTQERPEFFRESDHSHQGFMAAAGPAITTRGEHADVDVLDVAPTLLQLLGEPVPADLKGRPVTL